MSFNLFLIIFFAKSKTQNENGNSNNCFFQTCSSNQKTCLLIPAGRIGLYSLSVFVTMDVEIAKSWTIPKSSADAWHSAFERRNRIFASDQRMDNVEPRLKKYGHNDILIPKDETAMDGHEHNQPEFEEGLGNVISR